MAEWITAYGYPVLFLGTIINHPSLDCLKMHRTPPCVRPRDTKNFVELEKADAKNDVKG